MNYNNHIWIAELLWWIILNSSKKILIITKYQVWCGIQDYCNWCSIL